MDWGILIAGIILFIFSATLLYQERKERSKATDKGIKSVSDSQVTLSRKLTDVESRMGEWSESHKKMAIRNEHLENKGEHALNLIAMLTKNTQTDTDILKQRIKDLKPEPMQIELIFVDGGKKPKNPPPTSLLKKTSRQIKELSR